MKYVLFFCFFFWNTNLLTAQNEAAVQRLSLTGITEAGFSITIQGANIFSSDTSLTVRSIYRRVQDKITQSNISFIPDDQLHLSPDTPLLTMHINVLRSETGRTPFVANLKFYQPVTLPLSNNSQSSAVTWETNMLGTVSSQQLDIITSVTNNMIDQFIRDHQLANP